MRLLLDTCTFIWLTSDPGRLSKAVRKILQDELNILCLSDVSALEISFKWTSKKITLPSPPRRWIEEQAALWNLERISLAAKVIYRASELPHIHSDPFDRLLVATALEDDLVLVTPDKLLAEYPVAVAW